MKYVLVLGAILSCLAPVKASLAAGVDVGSSGARVVASEDPDFTEDSLPFPSKSSKPTYTSNYSASSSDSSGSLSLTPMVGASFFTNNWWTNVTNSYSTGLLFEIPISSLFSVEVEGDYARYWIQYGPTNHAFNQFGLGSNGKFYLVQNSILRPYVGAGLVALDYDGLMGINQYTGAWGPYNQWLGAGQVIAGAEVSLTSDVALGVRGTWGIPLMGRPQYMVPNGIAPRVGDVERAVVDSQYIRVMGSLKVTF